MANESNTEDFINKIKSRYEEVKKLADVDLTIDEMNLDTAVLDTPKLYAKWLNMFSEELLNYKKINDLRDKIKLERWKYYDGKQTDKYYAENGIIHEKILRSDIDKYLNADSKYQKINEICNAQKVMSDYIEKVMKEISSRNFHIKSAIEWRKFMAGGY